MAHSSCIRFSSAWIASMNHSDWLFCTYENYVYFGVRFQTSLCNLDNILFNEIYTFYKFFLLDSVFPFPSADNIYHKQYNFIFFFKLKLWLFQYLTKIFVKKSKCLSLYLMFSIFNCSQTFLFHLPPPKYTCRGFLLSSAYNLDLFLGSSYTLH